MRATKTDAVRQTEAYGLLGAVLLALGLLSLAYGGFSYAGETDKVKVGPIHTAVQEEERMNIPLWAGVGVVIVGVVLLSREG